MKDSRFTARTFSRRRALAGASGIFLGLPWFESQLPKARAQSAPQRPRRVLTVAYEMGIPNGLWRPTGSATAPVLPYVTAPLAPYLDRCLLVSGLDHRVLDRGGHSFVFGHPAKKESALTGTLTTGAFPTTNDNLLSEVIASPQTTGGANGPSFDTLLGAALHSSHPFPSVDLGIDGDAGLSTWGPPAQSQNSAFFFEGRGSPVSMQLHPNLAFDALFSGLNLDGGEPTEAELALAALRRRNKSVLDAVRESFTELRTGLGREDQRRLDEHAALIRDLELDIQVSATCSLPEGIPTSGTWAMTNMDELGTLMNRIMAHAMTCDLAPVGRIEYLNQQSPRFGITALDQILDETTENYDWHAMVHGDALPGTTAYLRPGRGSETTYDSRLADGYRFFVQKFAELLGMLDAIPEGEAGETALDHTLLVLASDLGEGLGHGNRKMGYVLAGALGGARRGYHFDAGPTAATDMPGVTNFYQDSLFEVNQLLNSIADMAEVTAEDGSPLEIGLAGHLADAGAPRRIDGLFE